MTNKKYITKGLEETKIISGVCQGLAEYLETDPFFIRMLFLCSALLGGAGILLYFFCHIAMPERKGNIS